MNLTRILFYLLSTIFISTIINANSTKRTFYCQSNVQTINNESSGTIITREENEKYITTGMFCKWKIIASQDSLIQLHIKSIDLSFTPRKGCDANLDSITVSDVVNGNIQNLGTFCRDSNPKYLLSQSNQLIIELQTKIGRVSKDLNLRGVDLDFKQISKTLPCLPEWSHLNQSCYYLAKEKDTFKFADAQNFCGYNKANLAQIQSRAELDIIKREILNENKFKQDLAESNQGIYVISSIKFWIGLNDLNKAGKLEWLDKSSPEFFDGTDNSNRNNRCIAMVLKRPLTSKSNIYWERQFCDYVSNPDKGRPFCKRGLLSEDEQVLKVPRLQEDRSSPDSFKWWIIILVLVFVILITIAIIIACVKYNRTKTRHTRNTRTNSSTITGRPSPPPSYREVVRNSLK